MKFYLSSRFRLSTSRLSLIRSALLLLAANCGWVSAATIANSSFEQNGPFPTFPGYINGAGNGPIIGWLSNADSNIGLNSAGFGGSNPFANNGTVPDGTRVAFVQSNGANSTLSTTITGLIPGNSYRVTYQTNARNGQTPIVVASAGASSVSTRVTSVGGTTTPYRPVGLSFTATAATANLSIQNTAVGDNTVLVDNFNVLDGGTGWAASAWNGDATSGINTGLTASRVYTHAVDFGANAGTTVNGLAFTAAPGGSPSGANFTTSGFDTALGDSNNITAGGGGSGDLANDFVYRATGTAAETITLNGLTTGSPYLFSVFGVGFDPDLRTATFDLNGDLLTVNENQFGDNNGIRLDYLFYAAGTSQAISFTPTSNASFHTYAFANALLPEPSRALFLLAGGVFLLFRRRAA